MSSTRRAKVPFMARPAAADKKSSLNRRYLKERRMWRFAAAAGTAACCLRSEWERRHFVTQTYELSSEKVKEEKTFVFLSDLHDNCFGPGQKELLDGIRGIHPDAVLIGGDMMVVKKEARLEASLFLVKKLARLYPVYYGNGNHENRMDQKRTEYGDQYDVLVRELKKAGVCHLSDMSVDLPGNIRVSGLNLEKKHYKKRAGSGLDTCYIERRLGAASQDRYQILLAHSPLFREAYARWGADLTLSGHFHGGTIRLPGLGGVMTPQFHFFLDCCGGCLKTGEKAIIVSRGLGTHSINIRLNNRPELVAARIKPKEKNAMDGRRKQQEKSDDGHILQTGEF